MEEERPVTYKTVAIIGGGASGLMSAIVAAQEGHVVHLFEKNAHVGKKILASGNGRCNISNKNLHVSDYYSRQPAFAAEALQRFTFHDFETFCFQIGLLLDTKKDGRAYPRSYEAKAVVTALRRYALQCGVTIVTDTFVEKVVKNRDHFHLHVNSHLYDAVIVATGSQAAPQLGASDSGYTIARSFQHHIIPPYPSLVQLCLESTCHAKMAGVKQHAGVTLYINNKQEEQTRGDILFTKYGISGFAILDISHAASLALQSQQCVTLGIDLFAQTPRPKLLKLLHDTCHRLESYSIAEIVSLLIPSKMVPHLLHAAHIAPQTSAKILNTKTVKQIVNLLKDWRFTVTQTHGFQHAEVSGGGVDTAELNPHTFESLQCKNLYFVGEVCDIVGRRGGYNLHFAWASGYAAAQAIST